MSYEPQILLSKPDLEKNREEIQNEFYKQDKKLRTDKARYKKQAWSQLFKLLDEEPVKIAGAELLLTWVELTIPNDIFRSLLMELEIEFVTFN